jgi:hypothetical protein
LISYISSPQVGIPVGAVITIAGIILLIRAHRGKAKSKENPTNNEIQPSSWKGLSEAEFAQLSAAFVSMKVQHGHTDRDGLVDDLKNKKPLNGPCWRCGKPRFGKGGPLK